MINYSLIIPHYNIPDLLQRCLDSIPKRNDLQIIVVDDNSSPEVVDFDNFPGKDMENVEIVLSKESGKGAGYARNIGLSLAKGKWLLFSDADDFYNPSFNAFLDANIDNENDLIFFGANSVDTVSLIKTYRDERLNKFIKWYRSEDKYEHHKGEMRLRYKFAEPWSRMVRKSVVDENNIKFDETLIHNDTRFAYLTGFYAKTVGVDPTEHYCITTREKSVSRNTSPEAQLTTVKIYATSARFFRKHKIPAREIRYAGQLLECRKDPETFKRAFKIVRELGFGRVDIYFQMFLYKFRSLFHRSLFEKGR